MCTPEEACYKDDQLPNKAFVLQIFHGLGHPYSQIELPPTYSNRVILSYLLFQTQNHYLWICPSVINYQLFQTPAV